MQKIGKKRLMKKLESALHTALKNNKAKSILLEVEATSYLETNIKTVRLLQKNGLSGVYISIQRPFNNISSLLKKQGVNLNKIIFIDVASAAVKAPQEKCPGCTHVSPELDIDELITTINTSLETLENKIKGKENKIKSKKFIFIDSLTTFALHKPLSEMYRFTEFLMRLVKSEEEVILIFNVAKDLSNKKFIQNAVAHADKIIEVKA